MSEANDGAPDQQARAMIGMWSVGQHAYATVPLAKLTLADCYRFGLAVGTVREVIGAPDHGPRYTLPVDEDGGYELCFDGKKIGHVTHYSDAQALFKALEHVRRPAP